ncbi:MAG: alpha-amylase, partial [Candidatus Cloacimonetes bacterium]|nr:alpha-amylase [Candidatus Cloacimonadota bacterium]MCF7869488.1 alpha-amylase [Candidatus Cloacimonadota bacterium]
MLLRKKRHLLISKKSRDKYNFNQDLFSQTGNAVFANFHAVRNFSDKINSKRNVVEFPERSVSAGEINGMGLIHEILHMMIKKYYAQEGQSIAEKAYQHLQDSYSQQEVDRTIKTFIEEFPPPEVYKQKMSVGEYFKKSVDTDEKYVLLEEIALLWLTNVNPAFSEYQELFDDDRLERNSKYFDIIQDLKDFFEDQPKFGPKYENLIEMLQAPAKAVPHSIDGQLEWIRTNWGNLLGDYFYRILMGLDLIKEETKMRAPGPGPTLKQRFDHLEAEKEQFSEDLDWMPNVVILAKNTYVWLHQLSEKYDQDISRLDQIPDQELDELARRGFTSLWLIGLWERSNASQKIKQMMGNPEAVASAYSLYDYIIANDLGGEEAYQNLRNRARSRGIRLCGDMVPNHVGLDGKWVIEHPDWFISQNYPPFPGYSFNGSDVCDDDRVSIYLEDEYYEKTDAAVVFKRVDNHTGDTRYIYHGNDGTSMPWNDTAQLNYLKSEVREAVINTILHVANKFDVIRFDAAMTLAKKHYQRLWFPRPGTGGDIPSRTEHSMSREEFEEHFPKEFWREVVDRIHEEEPDTLLLAEAFWMMEGYFVRTLGMHRVYNSAFMNMIKNEDNAKYRQAIKDVLEFNPQILKRYVNFMNNPDEDTAHAQFGADDKYFGTCAMMVTLPGLPMFGHGQVEGYKEKYGMEFKKAYWDEDPDQELIKRHEREIFPLLHKRYLFSEVNNFYLYDFVTPDGHVDENVFAYSNKARGERAIVLYNNKFQETSGWIKHSASKVKPSLNGEENETVSRELANALDLNHGHNHFTIFRDHTNGLEYIRNNAKLHHDGMYVSLGAFKYHVFLDFRQVEDRDNIYSELADFLDGRGVPDINEALQETMLQPVHQASRAIFNQNQFNSLFKKPNLEYSEPEKEKLLAEVQTSYQNFLSEIED